VTTRQVVRAGLTRTLSPKLVDELLDAYEEAKRNYYLGGHRLSEVEGGRFCEAAFRLLQEQTKLVVTPLGKSLDSEKTISNLANLPASSYSDAVRLHIPRALRLVYDIRNARDAAHLADGIDPNVQDSTLVVSVLDWVMAEFVRLHHGVSAAEASKVVEQLVTRAVPAIQEFGDFKKVLRPELSASEHLLVLLYAAEPDGASFEQLERWSRAEMRANLRRTLNALDRKSLIHLDNPVRITREGMRFVENNQLFGER